jgi:hypothetical protein
MNKQICFHGIEQPMLCKSVSISSEACVLSDFNSRSELLLISNGSSTQCDIRERSFHRDAVDCNLSDSLKENSDDIVGVQHYMVPKISVSDALEDHTTNTVQLHVSNIDFSCKSLNEASFAFRRRKSLEVLDIEGSFSHVDAKSSSQGVSCRLDYSEQASLVSDELRDKEANVGCQCLPIFTRALDVADRETETTQLTNAQKLDLFVTELESMKQRFAVSYAT